MKNIFLLSAVAFAVSACGGGSGGSSNSASTGGSDNGGTVVTPPVTTPAAMSVTGRIENVAQNGSVITVNGQSFSVANVVYSTETLAPSVLAPNMTVNLTPAPQSMSAKNGLAAQSMNVTVEPSIAGLVTAKGETTFSVNGVELEYANLGTDVLVGDWVFVSSLPTANTGYDVLSVVKIDIENDYPGMVNHYEIEGRISQIDPNNRSLVLGVNINVDYSQALRVPTTLNVGQWIEVEGTSVNGTFVANEIELEGFDDAFDDMDIEGIVTSVTTNANAQPTGFTLNYRGSFTIDSSTRFCLDDTVNCNVSASELTRGVEVEVLSRRVGNELIATRVEFDTPDWDDNGTWAGNEFECEGIANYNAQTNSFTVTRCENGADQPISNNTVIIDALTRFEGINTSNLHQSLVEVEGVIINGQNIAREIERED